MTQLKKTALYDLHQQAGAKMVAFAGYQMPIQYKNGIIHEHLHCRNKVGLFDISHMGQFLLHGSEASADLEKLTPGTITQLKPGQQQYTVLTNADGGIIDDIIVSCFNDEMMLVANAACKEKDLQHLQRNLSENSAIRELNQHSLLALQGPCAAEIIQQLLPEAGKLKFMHACRAEINDIDCTISRSGYTGEDGFEISIPNEHAKELAEIIMTYPTVEWIGLGARDTLRLEAGLSLYGHELNETISPVEAGLQWVVRNHQNCYPGSGTLLNQLQNGAPRQRAGLIIEARIPVREKTEVFDGHDNLLGHITSGSYSPSLGKPIALALLKSDSAFIGDTLFSRVRNQLIKMTVCDLPFVPHRYLRG